MKSLCLFLLLSVSCAMYAVTGTTAPGNTPSAEAGKVKARLGVSMLSPNGVDEKTAGEISEKLYAKISALRSGQVVYRAKGLDRRSANRILTGRISRLGSSTIIAISVLDGEKGNVLYNRSSTVKVGDSVDTCLDKVAREISNTDGIWK